MTPETEVYNAFFSLITDDMYLEISPEKTKEDCHDLLTLSNTLFEFPRHVIEQTSVIDEASGEAVPMLTPKLTQEEIQILATGMVQYWLSRQINSIEVVRQKFSGSDFKLTSQASHLQRLLALLQKVKDEHRRLQMLYTRREIRNGYVVSTFGEMVNGSRKSTSRRRGRL